MADLKYSRLLVKFSGESVAGEEGIGIDPKILDSMAISIKLCKELGSEIGIVIGGGNLFRGERLSQSGMDRVCLLYTSPSPRDLVISRMPSAA